MNVSMQDSFNLGWKLAAVLLGHGRPELLETYSRERQAIAKELIDFDREWAAMFSAQPKDDGAPGAEGVDPAELREYFIEKGRFTAGVATQYRASMICGDTVWQSLATGLPVGMRFHSAPVVRLSDARVLQLGHEVKADGRWRLFIFAGEGDMGQAGSPVADLCHYLLNDARSPIVRYTPQGTDIDGLIDVRAIFQASHHHLDFSSQPDLLRPLKGRYRLRDYEKIFCAEVRGAPDIYNLRGIDRQKGCMVLVRPDQYVAQVQPLDAIGQLAGFFDSFLVKQ
jgi:phenol 2-monooxygenase